MDKNLVYIVIFAAIIAAIAMVVAFIGTYWYYFAGAGLVGFGIYFFAKKKSDQGNKV